MRSGRGEPVEGASRARLALASLLLCGSVLAVSSCADSTPGLPGERDVKETGGGFASMPTVPENASSLRRDAYFQGAMLGRRYAVVFDMLSTRCRAVVGSPDGVEQHLGRWDELPHDLGQEQAERDSDVVVSKLRWKGRDIELIWRREAGVWRVDTCDSA